MLATFKHIWAIDFEFVANPGERPEVVCMVAEDVRSGDVIRLWAGDFPDRPPFPTGPDSLIVTFFGSAEFGCFLQLGWPMPARHIDLYVEYRALRNGKGTVAGRDLLGALVAYGLPGITKEEKTASRDLVMKGGPWSEAEKQEILTYCASDVTSTARLFGAMLPDILSKPKGLGHALYRGRYIIAVAHMEHIGVPIDVDLLRDLDANWPGIKARLVAEIDPDEEIYDGLTFKHDKFERWLAKHRIPWPRLASGKLGLDSDLFREMAKAHPAVAPIKELRHAMGQLRLTDLAVGSDGRNRTLLSPFGSLTSRNLPSNSRFIFGPSTWLRGLIKPEPGTVLAYIDWSSQEIGIAAALSGDEKMIDGVRSGDPYLAFAKAAGLAPPDATKETHRAVRDLCKTCVLGINYDMQATSLSGRIEGCRAEAAHLIELHAATYRRFTRWAQDNVDNAILGGSIQTVFGWPYYAGPNTNPRTLRNFPMQANGAEMMRLACSRLTEEGIRVCAPVHDAIVIEADEAGADETIARAQIIMAEASTVVLDGVLTLKTDAKVVRHPDGYSDPRGEVMWERVTGILADLRREGTIPYNIGEIGDIEDIEQGTQSVRVAYPICPSCLPNLSDMPEVLNPGVAANV